MQSYQARNEVYQSAGYQSNDSYRYSARQVQSPRQVDSRLICYCNDCVVFCYGGHESNLGRLSIHVFLYLALSGMGLHYDLPSKRDDHTEVVRLVLSVGHSRNISYSIHEYDVEEGRKSLQGTTLDPIVKPTIEGAHVYACRPGGAGRVPIAFKDPSKQTVFVMQHMVHKLLPGESSTTFIVDLPLPPDGAARLLQDINARCLSRLWSGYTGRPTHVSPVPVYHSPSVPLLPTTAHVQQYKNRILGLNFVSNPSTLICEVCKTHPASTYEKRVDERQHLGAFKVTRCSGCAKQESNRQFLNMPCRRMCGMESPLDPKLVCRPCIDEAQAQRKCDSCDQIGCYSTWTKCFECFKNARAQRKCDPCDHGGCFDSRNICYGCYDKERQEKTCQTDGCENLRHDGYNTNYCRDCFKNKEVRDRWLRG